METCVRQAVSFSKSQIQSVIATPATRLSGRQGQVSVLRDVARVPAAQRSGNPSRRGSSTAPPGTVRQDRCAPVAGVRSTLSRADPAETQP
jgi:hypothetical protein